MKAITIWQPYASLLALGLKKFETRGWITRYRGPLLIHAASKTTHTVTFDEWGAVRPYLERILRSSQAFAEHVDSHYGCIVAAATLSDCLSIDEELVFLQSEHELEFGDWQLGRFAWKLDLVRQVHDKLIQCPGRQKLWNPPSDLVVRAQDNLVPF